jgi:hypothetical protein
MGMFSSETRICGLGLNNNHEGVNTMATDLHRIYQRMDKQMPSRLEMSLRGWLLLAVGLIMLSVLIGGFNVGH